MVEWHPSDEMLNADPNSLLLLSQTGHDTQYCRTGTVTGRDTQYCRTGTVTGRDTQHPRTWDSDRPRHSTPQDRGQ
jgi:hypothetical protein